MTRAEKVRIDRWDVYPSLNRCERDGHRVELAPRTMDVLVHLIEHAGEVVSRDELIEHLWRGRVVSDEQVYKRISEIRHALDGGPREHSLIQTVPKRGYRLVASVAASHRTPPGPARAGPRRLRMLAGQAAALGVIAAAAAIVTVVREPAPAPAAASAPRLAAAEPRSASPTTSREAYALYVKAGTTDVLPGLPAASRHLYLDEALALDPGFALARARKANAYALSLVDNMISGLASRSSPRDAALAYRYARDALALEPDLTEAHTALARLNQYAWRWRAAGENYRDAYAHDPDNVDLLRLYSHFASYTGAHSLARAMAERAVELSPNTPSLRFRRGTVALNDGDVGGAVAAFESAVELDPQFTNAHLYLGIAQAVADRAEKAMRELEVAEDLLVRDPMPYQLALLAYGYHRANSPGDAARISARYADATRGRAGGIGSDLFVDLSTGRREAAIACMRAAIESARDHEPDVSYNTLMLAKTNAFADPVLDEPPFQRARDSLDQLLHYL